MEGFKPMIEAPVKMLLIFIDQTDTWHNIPLHEAIVRILEQNGIAGATVFSGIMGYGIHRRIHRRGLLGVSDDKPLTIAVIDNEKKLRDALPTIRPMIREGLIGLMDLEIV
jgi:PII-like signaling protein